MVGHGWIGSAVTPMGVWIEGRGLFDCSRVPNLYRSSPMQLWFTGFLGLVPISLVVSLGTDKRDPLGPLEIWMEGLRHTLKICI
jgi:hypothetical protein